MSEIKVNKISPRTNCGTTTLGDSGDTFTIPAGVSITNSGTASGFGSTGEVSWVTTKKTATFTATAGEGYFCDTSSGAFTVNLPAGTAGNSFAVADYTNTFQTNGLTISPNGSQKIGGVNADVTLITEGQSAYFVYVDDTEGWKNVIDSTSNLTGNAFLTASGGTETTCGNFKIHTFTGPGTFTVSTLAACAADNDVDYLVVAGGGGGATNYGGGGGGGFRYFANTTNNPQSGNPGSPLNGYGSPTPSGTKITVTATGFPITVGGGGAGGPFPGGAGSRGVPSVFSTVTSTGGGGSSNGCTAVPEGPGGSGGGGGNTGSPVTNGTGNTPPVTPSQGNPGGNGLNVPGVCNTGGGGGGAIAAGAAGVTPYRGGNGGAGAGITGFGAGNGECSSCKQYFSGGGGASSQPGRGSPYSNGGLGGGGDGKYACLPSPTTNGQGGTDNTGGGGGGGVTPSTPSPGGGNGGSGIVVIRYKYQ